MFRRLLATGAFAAALMLPGAAMAEPLASDWDALIKAAQREGKVEVNLGGQMPRKLGKAMAAFEKKYNVKVNYNTGGSRAHRARLFAERRQGIYSVDVWVGGANGALAELYPNGLLVPIDGMLMDPEVTDTSKWFQGKHHYSDPEGNLIFTWGASPSYNVAYNTNLVKPGEIKSYHDVLNPKWKGKIVSWDPSRSGTAASAVPMYLNPKIGEEWFRRWLTEMDVVIVRDARQGAEWVATGRYAIGMFGMSTNAKALEDQGFPIRSYTPEPMAEGEVLSASAANIYVIKDAPNPNAAALFLNWVLSKDAQAEFIKLGQTMDSLRRDVPNDTIAPQNRIDPKADYYAAFSEKAYIERSSEIMEKLKTLVKETARARK